MMTADPTVTLPPSPPKWVIAILNALIGLLLRSPLHAPLSRVTILLSFTGAKSGKRYTFPVGYYDHHGSDLAVIPHHAWWKNLRGSVPVTVWLKGRKYQATASAALGDDQTLAALEPLIAGSQNFARLYKIPRDASGRPDPDRVRQVARALPLVRIRLESPG